MSTSAERMRRLRERKTAGLEPVPDAAPRDPETLLLPAVEMTIAALGLGDRGAAVGALARTLAAAVDDAQNRTAALIKLGPVLLKVLNQMHATPASRPARKSPGRAPGGTGINPVRQLRAEHAARMAKAGRNRPG
jgi:hypothetical protein